MKKALYRITNVLLVCLMLSFVSACSDNDYPTTGVLNVSFTKWPGSLNNHLYIGITSFEQENKVLKCIYEGTKKTYEFELNPGNYNVLIRADNSDLPYITEYVQVQAGKTEYLQVAIE